MSLLMLDKLSKSWLSGPSSREMDENEKLRLWLSLEIKQIAGRAKRVEVVDNGVNENRRTKENA